MTTIQMHPDPHVFTHRVTRRLMAVYVEAGIAFPLIRATQVLNAATGYAGDWDYYLGRADRLFYQDGDQCLDARDGSIYDARDGIPA